MLFHWDQATWSWLKLMPTRGRGKWGTGGRKNHMKWSIKLQKASLPTLWKTVDGMLMSSTLKLFLITPTKGTPLCMVMWTEWARCADCPGGVKLWKTVRQRKCHKVWIFCCWHSARQMKLLGWVSRKLCAFLWTFSGAFLLDQGWKIWCRGTRGVWKSTSVFWEQRYWSHWWGLEDMTDQNYFDPTSLHSGYCNHITLGGMKWRH